MFDIGFWELAVIGVVALIVIGPEKLPAVARTMGFWIGKARRFVSTVQEDINREISKSEELKRLLEEQSKIKEMHEIIEHTVDETKKTVSIGRPTQPQTQPQTQPTIQPTKSPDDHRQADQLENQPEGEPAATASKSPDPETSPTADRVNEQTK